LAFNFSLFDIEILAGALALYIFITVEFFASVYGRLSYIFNRYKLRNAGFTVTAVFLILVTARQVLLALHII
jgi:hypothetical protein